MRRTVRRILTALIIVILTIVDLYYLNRAVPEFGAYIKYATAGLLLFGGVVVSRELSKFISIEFEPELKKNAPVAGNAVKICGYLAAAALAASYLSFSPTTLLATAAFSGLVLGLALQPTLGSFFAGILVLLTGSVKPGSQVRILTWHNPFQGARNPGYKYFSPDSVYAGYMGEVLEVGLFFTKIVTEEGQLMKIPNTIIATDAAIVSYTEENFFFNVRYEFPNRFDPEMVLRRVRQVISKYPMVNLFVNEQSDKEYYIVKAVLNAEEKDHAIIKSEILTRLIRLHRELELEEDGAKASSGGTARKSSQ